MLTPLLPTGVISCRRGTRPSISRDRSVASASGASAKGGGKRRIGRNRRLEVKANRNHTVDSERAEKRRERGNDNDLRLQNILRVAQ